MLTVICRPGWPIYIYIYMTAVGVLHVVARRSGLTLQRGHCCHMSLPRLLRGALHMLSHAPIEVWYETAARELPIVPGLASNNSGILLSHFWPVIPRVNYCPRSVQWQRVNYCPRSVQWHSGWIIVPGLTIDRLQQENYYPRAGQWHSGTIIVSGLANDHSAGIGGDTILSVQPAAAILYGVVSRVSLKCRCAGAPPPRTGDTVGATPPLKVTQTGPRPPSWLVTLMEPRPSSGDTIDNTPFY